MNYYMQDFLDNSAHNFKGNLPGKKVHLIFQNFWFSLKETLNPYPKHFFVCVKTVIFPRKQQLFLKDGERNIICLTTVA